MQYTHSQRTYFKQNALHTPFHSFPSARTMVRWAPSFLRGARRRNHPLHCNECNDMCIWIWTSEGNFCLYHCQPRGPLKYIGTCTPKQSYTVHTYNYIECYHISKNVAHCTKSEHMAKICTSVMQLVNKILVLYISNGNANRKKKDSNLDGT
jgi:hypothetical protein